MNFTENDLLVYWEKIIKIQKRAKYCILLAEQYGINLSTFIPAMKEQRDAHEHIIRAYSCALGLSDSHKYDLKYIFDNLDKAIGHEYRSLYDAYDFLYISISDRIDRLLLGLSKIDRQKLFSNSNVLDSLVNIPRIIAEARNNKDIDSENNNFLILNEYNKAIDSLMGVYKQIAEILKTYYSSCTVPTSGLADCKYNAIQVAKWFLERSMHDYKIGVTDEIMSDLKIQALLYYAQGSAFVITEIPIFEEDFTAQKNGPAIQEVRWFLEEYRKMNNGFSADSELPENVFDSKIENILESVYNDYGQFSAWKLTEMVCSEEPWKKSSEGEIIGKEFIKEHFKKMSCLRVRFAT